MKIRVKAPFFDERGIHKRDDIVEVNPDKFNSVLMEPVIEEKKTEKVEKAIKTDAKKTTRKKG